jgi:hypothetical protein
LDDEPREDFALREAQIFHTTWFIVERVVPSDFPVYAEEHEYTPLEVSFQLIESLMSSCRTS